MVTFGKLDKKRTFRFDMDAAFALEPHLPTGLYKAVRDRFGPSLIVLLLWAGFRWEDPKLSVGKMRKLVTKAIQKKRVTIAELQDFVLKHVIESEVFSGFVEPGLDDETGDDSDDGDEENPTGTSDGGGS